MQKLKTRLTAERRSGIKNGFWSAAKKEELVQALGAYEDTGMTPEEIRQMQAKIKKIIETREVN